MGQAFVPKRAWWDEKDEESKSTGTQLYPVLDQIKQLVVTLNRLTSVEQDPDTKDALSEAAIALVKVQNMISNLSRQYT